MVKRKNKSLRKHPQHKLLLDENMAPRERYKEANKFFNLKHIKHDYNKGSYSDDEVYLIAKVESRMIVTSDKYDFRRIRKQRKDIEGDSPTIITVSMGLNPKEIDSKIVSCVNNLTPSDLTNRVFKIH